MKNVPTDPKCIPVAHLYATLRGFCNAKIQEERWNPKIQEER